MEYDTKNEEKIEAVLFLSGRFLTMPDLVRYTDLNPLTIRECLGKLKEKYNNHTTMHITERDDAYKMDVKQNCFHLINKLATGSTEFTKAEQETLAIIAYKQPIMQATVVKIRGNKGYEHIKHLVQAGLIKAKKAGRTVELQTDESFYEYFSVGKREIAAEGIEPEIDVGEAKTETMEEQIKQTEIKAEEQTKVKKEQIEKAEEKEV